MSGNAVWCVSRMGDCSEASLNPMLKVLKNWFCLSECIGSSISNVTNRKGNQCALVLRYSLRKPVFISMRRW